MTYHLPTLGLNLVYARYIYGFYEGVRGPSYRLVRCGSWHPSSSFLSGGKWSEIKWSGIFSDNYALLALHSARERFVC